MKGFLHKTEQGWIVEYAKHSELPLHPDDVKQIEEDAKMFDSIEARIAAYPDVKFEIVTVCCTPEGQIKRYVDCKGCDKKLPYAKLIPSKEQEIPKTFEELFANTGIKPTTDENGNINYNFKAVKKEQQKQLITEIMDLDAKDGLYEDDVEKLAKESTDNFVNNYDTYKEVRQYAHAKGFIEGYNKSKEQAESIFANILDHLCDKMESISQEQIDKDNFQLARYRTFKYIFEYIQSLKQPKKD